MYTDLDFLSVDDVFLDFAHIVGDIVDLVQVEVFDFASQHFFEGLARPVGQQLPVGEGVVGCAAHSSQIIAAFG